MDRIQKLAAAIKAANDIMGNEFHDIIWNPSYGSKEEYEVFQDLIDLKSQLNRLEKIFDNAVKGDYGIINKNGKLVRIVPPPCAMFDRD